MTIIRPWIEEAQEEDAKDVEVEIIDSDSETEYDEADAQTTG